MTIISKTDKNSQAAEHTVPDNELHNTVFANVRGGVSHVPAPVLTWEQSNLPFKTVTINKGIRDWMDYDPGIAMWVHCCLTAFAVLPNVLVWECPVPDQWIELMGVKRIYFSNERSGVVSVSN